MKTAGEEINKGEPESSSSDYEIVKLRIQAKLEQLGWLEGFKLIFDLALIEKPYFVNGTRYSVAWFSTYYKVSPKIFKQWMQIFIPQLKYSGRRKFIEKEYNLIIEVIGSFNQEHQDPFDKKHLISLLYNKKSGITSKHYVELSKDLEAYCRSRNFPEETLTLTILPPNFVRGFYSHVTEKPLDQIGTFRNEKLSQRQKIQVLENELDKTIELPYQERQRRQNIDQRNFLHFLTSEENVGEKDQNL